jgi:hypothetical protein
MAGVRGELTLQRVRDRRERIAHQLARPLLAGAAVAVGARLARFVSAVHLIGIVFAFFLLFFFAIVLFFLVEVFFLFFVVVLLLLVSVLLAAVAAAVRAAAPRGTATCVAVCAAVVARFASSRGPYRASRVSLS